ncbi:MAG: nucleoside deaminase [Lachnospiraceae bacterium]|nr:nucleoside deaminase [Lachnospiraceae bacterium]
MDYSSDKDMKTEYMKLAIEQARIGIHAGHGGPFGSVIVRDGKIIGQGHNMVLKNNDSTAHGEVTAIRNAEQELGTYDLSGAEIYTTGEPCPMCLAACMWANISKVYYGCTIDDNESIGFRDAKFDQLLGGRAAMSEYLQQVGRDECLKLFDEYNHLEGRVIY